MPKRLNTGETKEALRSLGVNSSTARTFGVFDDARNVRYEFHRHRRHQLMFPIEGLLFVETKSAFYCCSLKSGLWVPAGVRHATTTGAHATVSVFFDAAKFPRLRQDATMVTITPLLREAAWRAVQEKGIPSAFAAALFRVIHDELAANLKDELQPTLPVAKSSVMQRTVDLAFQSLSSITIPQLAKQSGQGERSMRRRFAQEMGMGPELYIQRARLIRAMHLLVEKPKKAIIEVGLEIGYANHSAFSSAFRGFTGYTPTAFRAIFRNE